MGLIVVLLQGLVQHLIGGLQDQSTWIDHHMSTPVQQERGLVGVEFELRLGVLFLHAL